MEIKHLQFETIDSTNTWAKTHLDELDKSKLTLVSAGLQTKGRGQFNRVWISSANENIIATFVLYVDKNLEQIKNISQVLAVSIIELLKDQGFQGTIKWPNDILINGKKVGGILTETVSEGEGRWVICGVGLNVNASKELMQTIDKPATSLKCEKGETYSILELTSKLSQHFKNSLENFFSHGFGPFLLPFQRALIHQKGDQLTLTQHSGVFQSLNPDGSITLMLPDGYEKKFVTGEIADKGKEKAKSKEKMKPDEP